MDPHYWILRPRQRYPQLQRVPPQLHARRQRSVVRVVCNETRIAKNGLLRPCVAPEHAPPILLGFADHAATHLAFEYQLVRRLAPTRLTRAYDREALMNPERPMHIPLAEAASVPDPRDFVCQQVLLGYRPGRAQIFPTAPTRQLQAPLVARRAPYRQPVLWGSSASRPRPGCAKRIASLCSSWRA